MTEESKTESSEEQDLAQEALDATKDDTADDTASPADEPTVPLHKHTALRTRAQTAELEVATLKGRLQGITEAKAKAMPATKDPLDIEIARQAAEGVAEDDMTISPTIYRRHEQHVKQVDNAAAQAVADGQLRVQQNASKTMAMATHDDFNEVILAGQNHLTKGELLDIESAGDNFGELCYSMCQTAAERSKPAKTEAKTEKTAPKTEEESESEAEKAARIAAEKEVQSQDEILKGLNEDVDPVTARVMSL